MSIGLLCAIPPEWRHLHDAMSGTETAAVGPLTFTRGHLDGRDVVLVMAGIGKVNTAVVATLLHQRFGATTVLFSGVAGGIDPGLDIGDVVVGVHTVQHDAGVIENDRLEPYQAGHVPFFNPTDTLGYRSSETLVGHARAALADLQLPTLSASAAGGEPRQPRIVFGSVLSGDQYVHCEMTRERLHTRFQAQAVEMEGGALGQAGATLGFDWLDIRALSDLAGATSRADFKAFVGEVAASSALIIRRLLPAI